MSNDNSNLIASDGTLPDFEGKPVVASCINCTHNEDVGDGWEYGGSWYVCSKKGKEHISNLNGFPFKTPQKCCELHIAFTVDWNKKYEEEIKNGGLI
jgi:hypothetical protein